MTKSFDDVLSFIDSYTLDGQLYWRVKQLYSNEQYEVQWTASNSWRFKNVEHELWLECKTSTLIEDLSREKVDLVNFEEQVCGSALTQIVGAELIVKAGRDLFGDEVVNTQIGLWDNFRDDLVDAIDKIMKEDKTKEKKSKLTVVKNDV